MVRYLTPPIINNNMTIPDTIWMPVPNTNLFASSCGKIARFKNGEYLIKKPRINNNTGYLQINLSVNKKKITKPLHQLVAPAFLGPRPDGLVINHKDGNKHNNSAENLEYVTRKRNSKHAYDMGLTPKPPKLKAENRNPAKGEKHFKAKLTDAIVVEILTSPLGSRRLGRKFNVSKDAIQAVKRRKTWKHVTIPTSSPL